MKKLFVLALMMVAFSVNALAQNSDDASAAPKTLFPYPVAPDTIKTFENRVNYIVAKFWDNYNLSKPINDVQAFDGALRDYLSFMQYCHRTVAISSLRDFIFKSQSNAGNFEKIARLAEQDLYQVGAEFWSDELYCEFLKAETKSKALPSDMRKRYAKQMERINRTMIGASLADMEFANLDGNKVKLSSIEADMLMVYITKDGDADNSFERVRLSTDVGINNVLAGGKVKLLCISPEKYSKKWAESAINYADNWTVGASEDFSEDGPLDIRFIPSFIVLDKDKNIIQKNVALDAIKSVFNQ